MSDLVAALAERVLKNATAAGVKLATAESCRPVAWQLFFAADAPGASEFHGGFVTCTKENRVFVKSCG